MIARLTFLAALAGVCGCKVCPAAGTQTEPISVEQWAAESAAAVVSTLRQGDPCIDQDDAPPLSPASTAKPNEPCPPVADPCARCIVACDARTAACGTSDVVYAAALACAAERCADECSPH